MARGSSTGAHNTQKKKTSAACRTVPALRLKPKPPHRRPGIFLLGYNLFSDHYGNRRTSNVQLTLYTHCYTCPTHATHSRTHVKCTSVQYALHTHTCRREQTHTARLESASLGVRTQGSTTRAMRFGRSAILTTLVSARIAEY